MGRLLISPAYPIEHPHKTRADLYRGSFVAAKDDAFRDLCVALVNLLSTHMV